MTTCNRCGNASGEGTILFCGWQGGRAVYSNETCGSFVEAEGGREKPLTTDKIVSPPIVPDEPVPVTPAEEAEEKHSRAEERRRLKKIPE